MRSLYPCNSVGTCLEGSHALKTLARVQSEAGAGPHAPGATAPLRRACLGHEVFDLRRCSKTGAKADTLATCRAQICCGPGRTGINAAVLSTNSYRLLHAVLLPCIAKHSHLPMLYIVDSLNVPSKL